MTTCVKIIADSIYKGHRITTFEIEFPRIILPEFHTHKMIACNFSSNRAVKFDNTINNMKNNLYVPEKIGYNESGMSSSLYIKDKEEKENVQNVWKESFSQMENYAKTLSSMRVHKQWCNRLLEPYQYIKGVCTATDYDNFFWLRCDSKNAQPEIVKLANFMKCAYHYSIPDKLSKDVWHLAYFKYDLSSGKYYHIDDADKEYLFDLEDALKISVSLCAQVSYRKSDTTLEKANKIWEKLFGGGKIHASPASHQATPIYNGFNQDGVTHMFKNGMFGSGNLVGWVQYRHLIKNSDFCNHNRR